MAEQYKKKVSLILLIILAFLAYLLWPVVKGLMYVRNVQRNVRDAFEQASRGASGAAKGAGKRPRKKKIDKDVGEYVEFEEVSVSSGYSDTVKGAEGSCRSETETQIVDAEWEDLPPK